MEVDTTKEVNDVVVDVASDTDDDTLDATAGSEAH